LLIVVDKLLTGFDEPRNAVLYIDKPLKQHNLIQAIARVNRLHDQKKYGFLIDYRGILVELDAALTEYQDLADRTQGGFDIDDIDGLYANVSTEYKKLPALHDALWAIFARVRNRSDIEQFRQILVPRYSDDGSGEPVDLNQKVREDFYEALTNFGLCLRTALGSRSFFEDGAFSEAQIAAYKRDLKFFSELRRTSKQDAQETVDFSVYEGQIRKLVDRYVIGEAIAADGTLLVVTELAKEVPPEEWSEEKTRNETDIIRTRLTRTIEQALADDPYARRFFSELLKEAIAEAASLFGHPLKQYALFKDIEDKITDGAVDGTPAALAGKRHPTAYFGIIRLAVGDARALGPEIDAFAATALDIDAMVQNAVAENSLNPANVEAAVRKALLPRLFPLVGLDVARTVTDQVVEVTRAGLARDAS